MNTWRVILATMVIFAAGVVTGGMLTWRVESSRTEPRQKVSAARANLPPTPNRQRLELLRRAQRELNLTTEQKEKIDRILKESQERTRKLLEPIASEMRQELEKARQEFRQELTPEQQAKFDEMLKKQPHPREPRRTSTPAVEQTK